MSFVQISMSWDKAWSQYYEEFCDWICSNHMVGNGDMMIKYLEDPDSFEEFIAENHPEIGELT